MQHGVTMNRNSLKNWAENPWRIVKSLARRGWLNALPDKLYLSIQYRANFGKKLNWKAPRTFNEKLQWMKLYDRNPDYCQMVDKYAAKQFAASKIGSEYVVPALAGPWDDFDEIDFDTLPDQFVLKTTHDCGGVLICKDKKSMDYQAAKNFIQGHLQQNYYLTCREWPYKNIKPRIFAEEYLSEMDEDLKDYKFFCFDGVPKLMFIASERQSEVEETKFDFFDMDFNHLPIINGHPNASCMPMKPRNFEQMKALASVLSQGIPHLRVDFYECNGRLYLGELTFSHWGGFVPFEPSEWDEILGSWISLPDQTKE
jgi:hypothetical protein